MGWLKDRLKKGLGIVTPVSRWAWKKLQPDLPPAQGVMVEKQGADIPIPVVYGTRRVGAIKVHKYVTDASGGAANEYLHIIAVLCEGEIDAIVQIFFGGVSETDQKWNKSGGGKWFTVERYLGKPDQPASASAVSQIPNWTIDHKLNGLAYVYIRVQMDSEQSIWGGEPEITATVRGRKILDPRNSTVAYSENPALQLLDYLTNPIYGKGLNSTRIDLQSIVDSADLADEQLISDVVINEITTELYHKRFTSNIVLDTAGSVFNNVAKLLASIRGSLPIGSGVIRLGVETEGEPVFHFSHSSSDQLNHATITSQIKSKTGRKSDRYNRVVVRFPNINTDFENDEVFYPPVDNPLAQQWLDEDNGVRLEKSFEFESITSKAEAYQMAEILAKRSRSGMECSFKASPLSIVVEPDDIVAVTDDTRGWDAKPFRVIQTRLADDGDCDLDLIEHQNAIYPWSGTSYSERIGGTNLGDPANIPAPTGLSITPDPTFATAGRLTWNAANNAFIRRFDVRVLSGTTLVYSQEVLAPVFALPLLAAGSYTIQVYAVSTIGTRSAPAVISFELTAPVPPQSITVLASNFELDCRPQLAGAGLGTQFEFAIDSQSPVRGRGISMVFAGLKHGTEYRIYARTINALGVSAWMSVLASTTSDGADLIDLLGPGIADSIFDDVVEEVTSGLDDLLNGIDVDDPRDLIVEGINDAFEDVDLSKAVVKETIERRSAEKVLVADLIQLSATLQTETDTRTAQYQQLTTALTTETEARAEQITVLTAAVESETQQRVAEISSLNQALVNESTIRAQAVTNLNATLTQQGSSITATNQRVDQVEVNLNGTAQSLSVVQGAVNNPTTGLSASYSLAQSAKTDAAGNASALAGLRVAVAGTNSQAQAELILSATVDKAGEAHARAYFGVTTVSGGVARVNGIVVDGATNTLEFRADTMRLTNTAGVVQMYFDTGTARWVYNGDLIAANFKTANSGYRAEMGTGTWPFWYGTGTKNLANALFAVDTSGTVTLRNASVQGKIVTSEGTGIRVDVGNDGTYLLWAGTGAKTDVNGIFWIKANGQGFIKGDFFSGQIIESKFGAASSSTGVAALTASASGHDSAGKAVEITASGDVYLEMQGNTSGSVLILRATIRYGSTALRVTTHPFNGMYISDAGPSGVTYYGGSFGSSFVHQLATANNRNYSVQLEVLSIPSGSAQGGYTNLSIKTFENKLSS
jgi:hypothetical protein